MTSVQPETIAQISHHLREVAQELSLLNECLATEYKGALSQPRAHHKEPKAPANETTAPEVKPRIETKAITPKVIDLPLHNPRAAELARRYAKPQHTAKTKTRRKAVMNRLTPESRQDIIWLLQHTNIPVQKIADLFKVSRPSVYNLRDKHKINAHRGSPALIAGIKRYKAAQEKVKAMAEPAQETAPTATT